MAVYAISDLHLAQSIEKPMDVFGGRWSNYMEKIKTEWEATVCDGDTVIIPGDISWATYCEQAFEDFNFINSLPGTKIISKGNHDYWWTTLNKLNRFIEINKFSTIRFMHNNSFDFDNFVLCGTRGWKCPGDDDFSQEDSKIYNRELQRLELSIKSIEKPGNKKIIVALHYPPFNFKKEASGFVDLMIRYGASICIYGHLHGESCRNAVTGEESGLEFKLVSADYLNFKPLLL
jgi:predicted phosphohydrolase